MNLPIELKLVTISSAVEIALMSGTWFHAMAVKNAAWVDVAWSASFSLITLIYAALADGAPVRRAAITIMVFCWSLRLAIHIWRRVLRETHEDKRYAEMRDEWKGSANRNFFWLFQFQALTVIILSIPFVISCSDAEATFRFTEFLGIGLFIISLLGEMTADKQLQDFKANDNNKGKVCNIGLWNYSRHPNYFFEWMIWCAFSLFAIQSPHGAWSITAPLIMLLFLTKMSGVPLAEKQSLASKGDLYREYQRTTSVFIPWFKKKR